MQKFVLCRLKEGTEVWIYLVEGQVIYLKGEGESHTYLLLVLVCVTDVYTRTRLFPRLHLGFLHIIYLCVWENWSLITACKTCLHNHPLLASSSMWEPLEETSKKFSSNIDCCMVWWLVIGMHSLGPGETPPLPTRIGTLYILRLWLLSRLDYFCCNR